ncbi:MAG: sulfatase-like hydrolase/transferase, partial [Edaphobacter sp.]
MGLGSVSRRTALQLIAGHVAATTVALAKPLHAKRQQPNVVFVLADDLGYGDFACLGNPYIKTPNVDRMHESALRLTDFHSCPTCSPTRASLMTGKYCDSVGVWHTVMGRSLLDPSAKTLADCFKSSGYRTGIYGKWHLGDNYPCRPHERGFDDVVVCGGGGVWQAPDYFGNDDRDDHYLHNGKFEAYHGFATDVFFDLSMKFMSDSQAAGKPFFCYIPTPAAHQPTWGLEKDTAPYEHVPRLGKPGFYGMISN